MLRHSDDDLRNIDGRWWGPPRLTLPVPIPMRGIPIGAAVAVPAAVLLRAFGVPTLPMWALTLAIAAGAAQAVLAVTGTERPVHALAALFTGEVSAPRPVEDQPQPAVFQTARARRGHSSAPAGGRPR